MLDAFHIVAFENGRAPPTIKPPKSKHEKHATCFETLHIPQHLRYRPGRWPMDVPFPQKYQKINLDIRSHLIGDFEAPKKNILFFSHEDSHRRHWKNAQDIAHRLRLEQAYHFEIILMKGFADIAVRRQCELFYDADVIVMVHGAQAVNVICARPHTAILEFACDYFGCNGESKESFLKPMGFEYYAKIIGKSQEAIGNCSRPGNMDSNITIFYDFVFEFLKKHV